MVDGTPFMQCGETIRYENWSRCIDIWKTLVDGKPVLPKRECTLSTFKTLKEMEDLKKGINSYITHFNAAMEDGGGKYWLLKIRYW